MKNFKIHLKFLIPSLVLSSIFLSACTSTGGMSKSARVKLEYPQISQSIPFVDVRPETEKSFRVGVVSGYPESVALGDENFSPDRIFVLNNRLNDALKSSLNNHDEMRVERFEVYDYIRKVKTPGTADIVDGYLRTGQTQVLALPIVIPLQQILDKVVTSVAQVELKVQIKGKSYTSKMAKVLENGDRGYGISEAFNSAFEYLIGDIEKDLK